MRRWPPGSAHRRDCASIRETCGNALALEHNGDLYSCDHFVEPKYLLGNIKQQHLIELVSSDWRRSSLLSFPQGM